VGKGFVICESDWTGINIFQNLDLYLRVFIEEKYRDLKNKVKIIIIIIIDLQYKVI
jgi:hypothetical protein